MPLTQQLLQYVHQLSQKIDQRYKLLVCHTAVYQAHLL